MEYLKSYLTHGIRREVSVLDAGFMNELKVLLFPKQKSNNPSEKSVLMDLLIFGGG
jgi:hypothetical protein